MAAYARHVLGRTSVMVVAGDHDYGRSLADGFLELTAYSWAADREQLVETLAGLDSQEQSIHGIVGPIWFSDQGASVPPIAVGIREDRRFVSAPDQLLPFSPPAETSDATSPIRTSSSILKAHYQRMPWRRLDLTARTAFPPVAMLTALAYPAIYA